jgi:hypothetical protein
MLECSIKVSLVKCIWRFIGFENFKKKFFFYDGMKKCFVVFMLLVFNGHFEFEFFILFLTVILSINEFCYKMAQV